jgi:predicted permease
LIAVAVLLLAAVPGFLLVKKRVLGEECISGFSKILVFVCQPCLAVYTFKSAEYSPEKLADIGIFALLATAVPAVMLGGAFLLVNKKSATLVVYRIITIAAAFGNCAFFGIPIIEALFPKMASEVILYTTVYSVIMNITGWTVGSAIISRDTRYVSVRKIIMNPATLGTAVALVMFILEIPIEKNLFSMISSGAKMATPLSMIVMGMRLSTMKLSELFSDYRLYITIAVKQMFMPLIAFLIAFFLTGVDTGLRATFYITCSCPVASIVLNYSEIVGEGQKSAANLVLLSTALSILTLPLMMLLFPLIA